MNETIYVTDPATANEGYKALVTGLEKKLLPSVDGLRSGFSSRAIPT
ncbi:MAG TPA: hypothetical protein VEI95_18535 [Acidobacteriota bacterium]|nr:hypothetical protein [Acidobacteriota bacterium]